MAIVVALLAATAAGLFVFRTEVAEAVLTWRLTALGAPAPKFTVAELGPKRARVTGLSLGRQGELRADALTMTYALAGLLEGRLRGVVVEGLTLKADLTGGKPPLGSLQPLLAGKRGAAGGVRPPPISVTGGRIEAASPAGPVVIEFEGEILPDEAGGLSAAVSFELVSPFGRLKGIGGVSGGDLRTLSGGLIIDEGTLALPGAEVGRLAGEVDFALSDGRPEHLRARLAFSNLALAKASFDAARLELELDRTRITADAELSSAGNALAVTLRSTVDDYMTEPQLDLELGVRVTAGAAIWDMLALPPPSAGRGRLDLRLSGRLPAGAELPGSRDEALDWLLGGALGGRLALELASVGYPGRVSGLAARLELDAALEGGALSISLPVEARMRLAQVAPELLAGLPTELRRLLGRDLSLVLSASAKQPFRARLQRVATGAEVRLGGSARLTTATGATLAASAEVGLTFDDEMALGEVDVPRFALVLRDLVIAGQRVAEARLSGAVSGGPGDFEGAGEVVLRLPEVAVGALTAGPLEAGLPVAFSLNDGRAEVRLRGPGAVAIETLAYGGLVRLAKPLRLKVTAGAVALAKPEGAGGGLTHSLALEPGGIEVRIARQAGRALTVTAAPARILLAGKAGPDGPYRGRVTIEGARVSVLEHDVVLEDISATVALGPSEGGPMARFTVGALRHSGDPAFFAPLELTGRVTRRQDALALTAEAYGADGTRRVKLAARHNLGDGRGEAELRLIELAFRPGVLRPVDLFPVLGGLRAVSGNAAAAGRLAWAPDKFESSGVVELSDVSFTAGDITIEGLATKVHFDGLLPPSTPPGQELTVRRIDPAVPMDDVKLRFRVEPGERPRLLIERASLRFAGGRFLLNDVVFEPGSARRDVTLEVEELDMAKLFEIIDVEGLTGSGMLSGAIPVTVSGDAVMIRDGRLRATGPGVVRLRSEAAAAALKGAGEPMDLMLRALQNFHYDDLSLTVEKDAGGDARVTLHLRGNNPDVREGHPFAFNIALSGNLGGILDAIRKGTRISGALIRPALKN